MVVYDIYIYKPRLDDQKANQRNLDEHKHYYYIYHFCIYIYVSNNNNNIQTVIIGNKKHN